MRVALAQLNPIVGDFPGNVATAERVLSELAPEGPDLVVFPELFLTGYPPQDLLERDWFVSGAELALERLAASTRLVPEAGVLVGAVTRTGAATGKGLYNSAVLLKNGEIAGAAHKSLLPTYDVFDEARYFDSAPELAPIELGRERLGVTICEDAWNDPSLWRTTVYERDPVAALVRDGATMLINISASPFYVGKDETRYRLMSGHASRHGLPVVLVNQVGGNDELIFDGHSMCVAPDGSLLEYLPAFREAVRIVETDAGGGRAFEADGRLRSVHDALILGLRDYVRKCGFASVLIGLSGGIDSALVCALAVEAIGPENVVGVTMPSPYSSRGSVDDSVELAGNLGIRIETIPISEIYESYRAALREHIAPAKDRPVSVTEENIQARVRGNLLMALSNEHGSLLLTTGNKSEVAVGYCTLYGDMSGGLAVISDVPKTMVYDLARLINEDGERIPQSIIDKAPSAELCPDQCDQDALPPYPVLDRILEQYVDHGVSPDEIVAGGEDRSTVDWVARAVNTNEYKRRQAAPGLKVTSKAFGTGRRMPIAARYDIWAE